MDVKSLVNNYYRNNPNGHYFDKDTLKFFGESLSQMRVLKKTAFITDCYGVVRECYVLSKYSNTTNKRNYAYFDKDTFDVVV